MKCMRNNLALWLHYTVTRIAKVAQSKLFIRSDPIRSERDPKSNGKEEEKTNNPADGIAITKYLICRIVTVAKQATNKTS